MKVLRQASPCLKCWLLLCSDMAIRSGTAVKLGPANYDKGRRMLTFTTKYQNRQELPVTEELASILDTCTDAMLPFVGQLGRGNHAYFGWELKPTGRPMKAATLRENFKTLKEKCGIERDLRPHDLRRTTAKAMYDLTGDLRAVQALLGHSQLSSTLWYLDHHVTQVEVSNLELAKLDPTTETIQ
jgi:site-specific recombinase XerC